MRSAPRFRSGSLANASASVGLAAIAVTAQSCRRGSFVTCANQLISGITMDGGYQDYVSVPFEGLALIPDDLSPIEAGPLMCAGITTFNSLRNSGARAGDTVAVLGIGGLGHLGVQFASKMGFRTIAIARGKDKEALARQLGAHHYIDSQAGDVSEALRSSAARRSFWRRRRARTPWLRRLGGLSVDGRLDRARCGFQADAACHRRSHRPPQWYLWLASGSSIDSEDTMRFSAMTGVRPMTETFPLEKAAEAYERMMSNKARFRVVSQQGISARIAQTHRFASKRKPADRVVADAESDIGGTNHVCYAASCSVRRYGRNWPSVVSFSPGASSMPTPRHNQSN